MNVCARYLSSIQFYNTNTNCSQPAFTPDRFVNSFLPPACVHVRVTSLLCRRHNGAPPPPLLSNRAMTLATRSLTLPPVTSPGGGTADTAARDPGGATTSGPRLSGRRTGVLTFDVECTVLSQCLERLSGHWRTLQKQGAGDGGGVGGVGSAERCSGSAAPVSAGFRKRDGVRRVGAWGGGSRGGGGGDGGGGGGCERIDNFEVEMSIVRRAVARMQHAVRTALDEHPALQARAAQLEAANEALRFENTRLELRLAQAPSLAEAAAAAAEAAAAADPRMALVVLGSGTPRPASASSPPPPPPTRSRATLEEICGGDLDLDLGDDGAEGSSSSPLPAPGGSGGDAVVGRLADRQESAWAHVLRHLVYSSNEYCFLLDMTNPVLARRTALVAGADPFGLRSVAETASQMARPCILIRRLTRQRSDPFRAPLPASPAPGSGRVAELKKVWGAAAAAAAVEEADAAAPSPGDSDGKRGGGGGEGSDPSPTTGVMWFLGTEGGERPYKNPCIGDIKVMVGCSSAWGQSDPCTLLQREHAYFCTKDAPNQWISADLVDRVLMPTAYSIASSHPILTGYYPRNWNLEASLDGRVWAVLREHSNDETLGKSNPSAVFSLADRGVIEAARSAAVAAASPAAVPLPPASRHLGYFRCFRLRQTGPNSFGSHELQIGSVELYGDLLCVEEFSEPRSPPTPQQSRDVPGTLWDEAWCLPDVKPPKGGKAAKKKA